VHAYWTLDAQPWDVAAAGVILSQAGGLITDTDGGSWLYSDGGYVAANADRKSTRLNSSHVSMSYAVLCLKKKMRRLYRTEQRKHAEIMKQAHALSVG